MQISIRERAPDSVFEALVDFSAVVTQLLFNRGIVDATSAQAFLHPVYDDNFDPFLFRDMEVACTRIYDAIENKELIAIFGDYDADGISGAAILYTVLTRLGAQLAVYIPHREKEGYGLNRGAVDYLKGAGARLIITCDCGISNYDEVHYGNTLNIDTIVTDHHLLPLQLPAATAIIHPKREGETYPFKDLAGGGVAFKLAQALIRFSRSPVSDEKERERLEKWLLDLVALSSVADMVELVGENRLLTTYGLLVLRRNKRLGFQKMFAGAKINPATITTETIAFQIAPRINAAGRMDHANAAFMLLIEKDPVAAEKLAADLQRHNRERQRQTQSLFQEAKAMAQTQTASAFFLYKETWPIGLLGLAAGKIAKQYARPTFVLGHDGSRIVGSGRSPEGQPILRAVELVKEELIGYGGHAYACGLRFEPERLGVIQSKIVAYFESAKIVEELPVVVDRELFFSEITSELGDYLKLFEPLGVGNREPVFLSRACLVESAVAVGADKKHTKLMLRESSRRMPSIAFNMTSDQFEEGKYYDFIYSIRPNEWRGRSEIQLVISEVAASE